MGEPWAIVVVPTDEGRALLADGPCGGRVPYVGKYRYRENGVVKWSGWTAPSHPASCTRAALPLWWDGVPVPEGWDRARRVAFDAAGFSGGPDLAAALDAVEVMYPSAAGVLTLARALERAGLCRVAVLDLVDGAVVERAP